MSLSKWGNLRKPRDPNSYKVNFGQKSSGIYEQIAETFTQIKFIWGSECHKEEGRCGLKLLCASSEINDTPWLWDN